VKSDLLGDALGGEPLAANTARAVIEEKLRRAIYEGRLPAGMAIRQQALATLFSVSRMPVREALRQLEAQGLVHVVANKGAVVAPLITEDATETYALRILLESEALRLSLPLLVAEDFVDARRCIEALEAQTGFDEVGRLNREFHMSLYRRAPNQRLLRLVESGLVEEERFLRFNLAQMGLGKLTQEDHRALLAAVEAGDSALAIDLLQTHLQRGIAAIKRYLQLD